MTDELTRLQQIGPHHPAAVQVKDIQSNRTPNPRRYFVAEGVFENTIVLQTETEVESFLWCRELARTPDLDQLAQALIGRARRSYLVSERTLGRLAERPNSQGLLTISALPKYDADAMRFGGDALLLVADGVEIPGNLGTIIRTLDGCRGDCLVLTNRRTRLTHPKVLRSSQGTSIRIPWVEFDAVSDALDWLSAHEFRTYIADTDNAVNYRQAGYGGRIAVVVGNERYGVSPAWHERDLQRICVPMLGTADSLNVAISASIILYEIRAQKSRW